MSEQFIGYILGKTDRAIYFQDHFWHEPDWMPKSQIDMLSSHDTQEVIVIAKPWICGQKKIREFQERLPAPKDNEDGR